MEVVGVEKRASWSTLCTVDTLREAFRFLSEIERNGKLVQAELTLREQVRPGDGRLVVVAYHEKGKKDGSDNRPD